MSIHRQVHQFPRGPAPGARNRLGVARAHGRRCSRADSRHDGRRQLAHGVSRRDAERLQPAGAITAANANPGADTVVLSAGTYTLAIPGTGEDANATGDLDLTDDLTLQGAD